MLKIHTPSSSQSSESTPLKRGRRNVEHEQLAFGSWPLAEILRTWQIAKSERPKASCENRAAPSFITISNLLSNKP